MKLQVKVVKAANLAAKDPNGKSDPFCSVYLGATESDIHKTKIKPGTLDPEWNEVFDLYGSELAPFMHSDDRVEYQFSGYVIIDLWDHDTINQDDFLGQVMVPLRDVPLSPPSEGTWHPLARRTTKDKVSGSILLEIYLKVDKAKIVDNSRMNSELYQRCKLRGYHLPLQSGKDIVLLPGHTEKIEMAISNVYVDISSNHCVAQVYLTNYRIIILCNRQSTRNGRSRSSADLSTWIALNSIMSTELGHETIVVRKHRSKQKQKTTSITIHCFNVRVVKLIFTLEEERGVPSITTIPEAPIRTASAAAGRVVGVAEEKAPVLSSKQFGFRFKNKSSPALGKKFLQTFTDRNKPQSRGRGTQWHADLGIVNSKLISNEFKRTKSEVSANLPPHPSKERTLNGKEITFRPRSKSGDSATMSRHYGIESISDVGVANGDVGVAKDEVVSCHSNWERKILTEVPHRIKRERAADLRTKRLSRSTENISLTDTGGVREIEKCSLSPEEADFTILTYAEPDDLDTGGTYTVIFDELSDEECMLDDRSEEVKDLTPHNSSLHGGAGAGGGLEEGVEGGRVRAVPLTPPRASQLLIQALHQRLESVLINGVDFPPALSFVQKYEAYLQLTGWDLYNFPKEMDRQNVSYEKWKLSVQNGPDYCICATYPQLMYIPQGLQERIIEESANFRSKNRFPCLTWVDSKRKNFMLRCAQPLAGKTGKHSLQDEQLIEACLNSGPPDAHMIIYDARSIAAAAGNMLKGKGTENVTHYPRAKLTYLDIPNIHSVRESYDSLRSLCLSGESNKWHSSLENTQWLNFISLIIKGAVMIARYMKLQRGNTLVHCSDGWDRTSQLTSLSQIIMDPYYRTITGFMVLIDKEWLAFGHKFQHRLGYPEYPNERSPIFLQFLDCVHQMTRLFPKAFEFNDFFLLRIADHLHSGWFGTFLCNCDKERHDLSLYARSPSLWAHLIADKEALTNQEYSLDKQPIFPTSSVRHLKLWEEYFLRYDSSSLMPHGWKREMDRPETPGPQELQRGTSIFSDHLQESWQTDHVLWTADEKANECLFCHTKFTAFKRKHHCRACGHIFCDECSKNKIALTQLGYARPERVCVECYSKLNAAQKTSDTDDGFLLVSCRDSF